MKLGWTCNTVSKTFLSPCILPSGLIVLALTLVLLSYWLWTNLSWVSGSWYQRGVLPDSAGYLTVYCIHSFIHSFRHCARQNRFDYAKITNKPLPEAQGSYIFSLIHVRCELSGGFCSYSIWTCASLASAAGGRECDESCPGSLCFYVEMIHVTFTYMS